MAVNRLTGLLGNREIQDIFFWQTLGAILSAALAPEIAALQQESFKLTPTLVLGAAELADAVVRGHITREVAEEQARQGGLAADNFGILLDGAGQPPDFPTLAEAWRRGVIDQAGEGAASVSLEQGVRESRLKNKWIPVLEKLQFHLPDPGAVIEGWLRAQLTEAEARDLLYKNGLDTDAQTLLYNVNGRPPGPQELADMYHRGIIPETGTGRGAISLDQGFKETDLKDKWLPYWKRLQTYLPPPRTVTAMVREGSLDDAAAIRLYKDAGLSDELAAAYLASAHHQATAADRELTKADVLSLYYDELIPRAQAETMLGGLNYSPPVAAYLLDATDFRREKAILDSAVSRIRSLYIGHRLDKNGAVGALDGIGLPAANRDHLLLVWDQERAATVKLLTAAEIATATRMGILTVDEAGAELEAQGYTVRDAAIYLAIHNLIDPTQVPGA